MTWPPPEPDNQPDNAAWVPPQAPPQAPPQEPAQAPYPPPPASYPPAPGQPPGPPWTSEPRKNNGFAIASLVLGFFGCLSLLGVIFGIIALVKIRRTGERGKAMAIIGICLFAAWVLIFAVNLTVGIKVGGGDSSSGSPFQLFPKPGQCFDFSDGEPSVQTDIVTCDRPHDGEMVEVFSLPKESWPGEQEISRRAEAEYDRRMFARFQTRTPVKDGEAYIFYPTRLAWKIGDRRVHCSITAAEGGKLTASIGRTGSQNRQWNELKKGDCFQAPRGDVEIVQITACTEPHNAQVFHRFEIPSSAYPGDKVVARRADSGCDRVAKRLGRQPTRQPIDQWSLRPGAEDWAAGNRPVICYFQAAEGMLEKPLKIR